MQQASLESKLIGRWASHEETKNKRLNRDIIVEIKNDYTCISTTITQLDSQKHLNTQKGTWVLSGNNLIIHSASPNDPNQFIDIHSRIDSIDRNKLVILVEANPEIEMPAQTVSYTKTEQDAAANP